MIRDKVRKPTKKEQKELDELVKEMTDLSKEMVEDYIKNPSKMSGSYIHIHENSPFLKEKQ